MFRTQNLQTVSTSKYENFKQTKLESKRLLQFANCKDLKIKTTATSIFKLQELKTTKLQHLEMQNLQTGNFSQLEATTANYQNS